MLHRLWKLRHSNYVLPHIHTPKIFEHLIQYYFTFIIFIFRHTDPSDRGLWFHCCATEAPTIQVACPLNKPREKSGRAYNVFFFTQLGCEEHIKVHVWGSLGSALLQQCTNTTLLRFLSYATMLNDLRFIVAQQCNQQHCYARNNDTSFYGIRTSTDIKSVCWNSLECRRVFGYGLLLVGRLSSYREIARHTWVYTVDGEDIRSSGLMAG
jgi:hypothetical protein